MTHSLVLDVPETLYKSLTEKAAQNGKKVEEFAVEILASGDMSRNNDFERNADELADYFEKNMPPDAKPLSDYAMSREGIMKIICSLFLAFVFLKLTFPTLAQEREIKDLSCGTLVDDFGRITNDDLAARLDQLIIRLQEYPADAFVAIVVYRHVEAPLGYPLREGIRLKTDLIKRRGLDSNRIKLVDGGTTSTQKTELVLLEAKDNCLVSINTNTDFSSSKTFMFDDFEYIFPEEVFVGCCGLDGYYSIGNSASIDAFAELLKKERESKAYLIHYSRKCNEDCRNYPSDKANTSIRVLNTVRNELIKKHKIPSSRIILVNGGYKIDTRSLQLWFVPSNDKPPQIERGFPVENLNKKKK